MGVLTVILLGVGAAVGVVGAHLVLRKYGGGRVIIKTSRSAGARCVECGYTYRAQDGEECNRCGADLCGARRCVVNHKGGRRCAPPLGVGA